MGMPIKVRRKHFTGKEKVRRVLKGEERLISSGEWHGKRVEYLML